VDSRDGRGQFDGANGLGRTEVDGSWRTLRWDASFSTYLEPWFRPASLARGAGFRGALAHEVSLRLFGQYAFGGRLIPQEQAIAGGINTVRGYAQSAAIGDSVFGASAEYRFHLPRVLGVRPAVPLPLLGSFKVAADVPGGRPDWDLVFRLYADGARVKVSDPFSFELDQSLLGVGAGLELQLRRNFAARIDVGWPLLTGDRDASGNRLAERGRPELHFSLTTLY
jgi:hemolysin activation/secretion protein